MSGEGIQDESYVFDFSGTLVMVLFTEMEGINLTEKISGSVQTVMFDKCVRHSDRMHEVIETSI